MSPWDCDINASEKLHAGSLGIMAVVTGRCQPRRVSEIAERLGDRIRGLREAAAMSQEDLAAAAGISRVHLSSLERGVKDASLPTCARLAQALRIALPKLVDLEERPRAVRPIDRFVMKVASFAEGATVAELERAEKLMRVFFGR